MGTDGVKRKLGETSRRKSLRFFFFLITKDHFCELFFNLKMPELRELLIQSNRIPMRTYETIQMIKISQ